MKQHHSQPSRLEAGSTTRAAGSAGVAGIAGEGRIAAGAVAAMLAVVVPILTVVGLGGALPMMCARNEQILINSLLTEL
jgi:hypothetical protein